MQSQVQSPKLPPSLDQQPQKLPHYNTIIFDRDTKTIFIPAYLRTVLKSVQSLNLQSLQSEINLTFILNIVTYGLPEDIRTQIANNMIFQFNRDDILKLDQPAQYDIDGKLFQENFCKKLKLDKYLIPDINSRKSGKKDNAPRSVQQQNAQQEKEKHKIKLQQNRKQYQVKPQKSQKQQKIQSSQPLPKAQSELKIIQQKKQQQKQPKKDKDKKDGGDKKKKSKVKIGHKWTNRITRKAFVQPYIFFTPFEVVDLVLSITLRKIFIAKYNCTVRFNIFDTQVLDKKITFPQNTQFGYYNMATKRLHVQYTERPTHKTLMSLQKNFYNIKCLDNYRQQVQEDQQRPKQHNVTSIANAHFHIPLYKNPVTVVTTLFIPLWFLSSINLAIFSQSPSLGDRIGSIATLMIAFVGLIPITREQIPPNPTITIFQILVYMQVFTQLLCLWHSMENRTQDQDQITVFMHTYQPLYDPFFLIALLVSFIIFILPFGMCLYHMFVLKDQHWRPPEKTEVDKVFTDWTISQDAEALFGSEGFDKRDNLIYLHDKGFLNAIQQCVH